MCMTQKRNARYAIPCAFGDIVEEDDIEMCNPVFFLTFTTQNENEAYRLASCVCGNRGKRALVILTDKGEVYSL